MAAGRSSCAELLTRVLKIQRQRRRRRRRRRRRGRSSDLIESGERFPTFRYLNIF